MMSGHTGMTPKVFDEFRDIVYARSGISMDTSKQALLTARIGKRMRKLGLSDFKDYLKLLNSDKDGQELVEFLNVVSTNVTSFFRESSHFDLLAELMRGWVKDGQKRFRFWSAACSSGEEPYTMAMTLQEASQGHFPDIKILCTDIDTTVLQKCSDGVYSAQQVESVPTLMRTKYLEKIKDPGDDEARYQAKDVLRQMLTLKRLNLSQPPFPMTGPLDCVFCRNVMIYFDNRVREALVGEIQRLLKPGGMLMIGHSETLTGLKTKLKAVKPAVYIKPL